MSAPENLFSRTLQALRAIRGQRESVLTYGPETPWTPIAVVEGDWSDFPADQRLSREMLRDVAATFDPDVVRVPVIAAFNRQGVLGSGHWEGALLPPSGEIRDLDFDGFVLWARMSGIIDPDSGEDRIATTIKNGFTERSVAILASSAAHEGRPLLRHLAVLSMGETPGILNMPPLDEWLAGWSQTLAERSAWRGVEESSGAEIAKRTRAEWDEFGGLAPLLLSLQPAIYRSFAVSAPDVPAAEPEPETRAEDAMDPEELQAMIASAISAQIAPLAEQVTALAGRVEQLAETVGTMQSGSADTAKAAAEAAEAEHRANATAAVDEAIRTGHVKPADRARTLVDLQTGGPAALVAFRNICRNGRPAIDSIPVVVDEREGSPVYVEVPVAPSIAARHEIKGVDHLARMHNWLQARGVKPETASVQQKMAAHRATAMEEN